MCVCCKVSRNPFGFLLNNCSKKVYNYFEGMFLFPPKRIRSQKKKYFLARLKPKVEGQSPTQTPPSRRPQVSLEASSGVAAGE